MISRRHECILWLVTAFIDFSYGQFPDAEYCSVPCAQGQHTMCKYEPIGQNCQDVTSLMNENGRMKILSLHNSFRNALASGELKTVPASSNMRQLYWDLELEAIAERWALQCNASFNDDCRSVNRFSVGQIMSKSNIISPSVNYYEALMTKLWFPEIEHLNQAIITNYRQERQVKHIAQIISANAMRIGCADVLYMTVQNSKPVRVTVCNYGPMISSNEQIYRIGKPCTECPQRTECRGDLGKYPNLCAELRHFDVIQPERNFQVVEREYDDEDMDNIEVESNIFPKMNKDYNNRRKHNQIRKPLPNNAPPDYIEGGRSLEEGVKTGNSPSSDYEEVGMADDAAAADPKEKGEARKVNTTLKPSDPKRQIIGNITAIPGFPPGHPGYPPGHPGFGNESSLMRIDVILYLTGYAIIVLTTIRLRT